MSYTADFLTGVATDLNTASIGIWRPAGGYMASETAIAMSRMPADPDRAICLTAYTIDMYPDQAVATLRLQVRSRGNRNAPLDATALDEQTLAYLQGLQNRLYGTCQVNHVLLFSSIPMGADDLDRWEISTNYTVDVSNPSRE